MLPSTPLIAPDDAWLLWAVMLSAVALSIYLERTFRWAAKISGPVLALLMAMLLSNLKVMPQSAPAYDLVGSYLVSVAIPLLLFRANLFQIARSTGSLLIAFHLSVIGTMIGAIVATLLLRPSIPSIEKLAAIMTGSYIGGSVNFFAIKESYRISENLTGPLLVADNFIMAGFFVILLMLAGSKFIRRHYPHPHSLDEDSGEAQALAAEHWKRKEVSLLDIAKGLAIAFVIAALAHKGAAWLRQQFPGPLTAAFFGNAYILITTISVLVATFFHRSVSNIRGADELGGYLLYIFLFAIGLPTDLWLVLREVPVMFTFCLIIALGNLLFTMIAGKFLKLNLEELLLSVNASLGGPPTAVAMAVTKGWPKLVLPGLLAGLYGYVIGTFVGITIGELLLRWR
jgi:uncharacterized membrane protein